MGKDIQRESCARAKKALSSIGPVEPDTIKYFREFQDSNLKAPDRDFDATNSIYYDALEDSNKLKPKNKVLATKKPDYDREEFILSYLCFLGHITLDMCIMWRRHLKSIINRPIRELFDISTEIVTFDCLSGRFKEMARGSIKQL